MTAELFAQALEALGLSQLEAARQLGVDPRTVRYWIAGARRIPGPVVACLDAWLCGVEGIGLRPWQTREAAIAAALATASPTPETRST